MKPEDIFALPVQEIAEENCLLFMWVTFPNLNVALEAIRRWGFTYKTAAFVWVKRNKKSPSWFWGMGNWTRANAEVCLLATKGKPKRASASVHSIIDAPIGRHSEKPAETRDRSSGRFRLFCGRKEGRRSRQLCRKRHDVRRLRRSRHQRRRPSVLIFKW